MSADKDSGPTGSFNPREHLRTLRNKGGEAEYLDVRWRLVWLRSEHPDAEITTEHIVIDREEAVFRARVAIPGGGLATGYGSETRADFPAGHIEKAETKAVGRALAMLGYGTQFVGEDLDEGDRIADAPVDRPAPTRATTTPRAGSAGPGREAPAPRRSAPPTDRPAAVPSAAGPPSPGNGKRAPTVAEALAAAGNERLSAKARQYAAVKGLEACPTLDDCAGYYLKVLPLAPEREALEAAYRARNEALRVEAGLPF
jgi:hypothetical protein